MDEICFFLKIVKPKIVVWIQSCILNLVSLWNFKVQKNSCEMWWWWRGTIMSTVTSNSIEDFCGGDGAWTHWGAFYWCYSYCWWFTWTLGWWPPLLGRRSIRVQSSMAMLGGGRLDVALQPFLFLLLCIAKQHKLLAMEIFLAFYLLKLLQAWASSNFVDLVAISSWHVLQQMKFSKKNRSRSHQLPLLSCIHGCFTLLPNSNVGVHNHSFGNALLEW